MPFDLDGEFEQIEQVEQPGFSDVSGKAPYGKYDCTLHHASYAEKENYEVIGFTFVVTSGEHKGKLIDCPFFFSKDNANARGINLDRLKSALKALQLDNMRPSHFKVAATRDAVKGICAKINYLQNKNGYDTVYVNRA